MGVGKSMKTFISAMTEQTGMGGYGGKIKSTPMGPFRWNDLTQLWENVNNGMVMNNVSFQDMFMMGYETNSGDNGGAVINYTPTLSPADWGTLEGMDAYSTEYWASTAGPQLLVADGNNVVFSAITQPITVTITTSGVVGSLLANLKYSKNGGASTTYTTAISMSSGDTLKVGVTTQAGFPSTGSGNIVVTNTTLGVVLDTIPYSTIIE